MKSRGGTCIRTVSDTSGGNTQLPSQQRKVVRLHTPSPTLQQECLNTVAETSRAPTVLYPILCGDYSVLECVISTSPKCLHTHIVYDVCKDGPSGYMDAELSRLGPLIVIKRCFPNIYRLLCRIPSIFGADTRLSRSNIVFNIVFSTWKPSVDLCE